MTILGILVGITFGFGGGYWIAKVRQAVRIAEVTSKEEAMKLRLRVKGLVK
jgi:hypothetical protein